MIRAMCLAATLALAACTAAEEAPAPPLAAGHQAAEEAAVLATYDRFATIMSSNNMGRLAEVQVENGMTFRASPNADGTWTVQQRPNSYWLDPATDPGVSYRERYWAPTVMIRGPIAVVWAPFEFWVNGETSHCGVNLFNFVKVDGEWRVANSMWTVEPSACEELRPADPNAVRPVETASATP